MCRFIPIFSVLILPLLSLSEPLIAQKSAQEPDPLLAKVNALIAQYEKDAPQLMAEYRKAKTKAEMRAIADKALGKIDVIAKENPKTPAAERANIFLLQKSPFENRAEYFARIRRDHIDS